MYISNTPYSISDAIGGINNLRFILWSNIYNPETIQQLNDIIATHIDCISIDFDNTLSTFTIKIKKSSMKKIKGFDSTPIFYHNIMAQVFAEFLQRNEPLVLNAFRERYDNYIDVYNGLLADRNILSNLCLITCIADNIVYIKL